MHAQVRASGMERVTKGAKNYQTSVLGFLFLSLFCFLLGGVEAEGERES